MINFEDLKLEIQDEFISSNISEILYRRRRKDKLSQERFLEEYFEYNIYTKMTGIKYLNFIADIYGIDEKVRKEKIEEYNQKLELGDAIYSTIDSYSHGMRQKLVLIGALITSPKVLILDEPMVGLDVKTSFNLKNILPSSFESGLKPSTKSV